MAARRAHARIEGGIAGLVRRFNKCRVVGVHCRMGVVVGGNVHIDRKRMRLEGLGSSMGILPPITVGAFMLTMLAGLPDPRCAQCVREQGPLTVVGGQMDDVATTGRLWTKHNSCGFGTISTHLPTIPLDLAYARVVALHLPLPVPARAPTCCPTLHKRMSILHHGALARSYRETLEYPS